MTDGAGFSVTDGTRASSSKALHVLTPAQCGSAPVRDYIIKGILSRGDHGGIIAPPGSGKSALAPFIGYQIARGEPIFGHRTRKVGVLYLAAEDGAGMTARVRALFERMGDAPGFLLQPLPVDLLTHDSPHIAEIEALISKYQPGLIILDTIARAFAGMAENDSEAMGRVVKIARSFTTKCDSAVLSIHHPPKSGPQTARGHGLLAGDMDVTLFIEGERSEPRHVTMGKNRSGPSDLTFDFKLAIHTFGRDDDGDPITAPVAEPIEDAAPRRTKLTPAERNAMTFLTDLLCTQAQPLPAGEGFPSAGRGVREADWRGACDKRRLSTAEKPKDRGRVFRTTSQKLRDGGIIGLCDGWVWLTEKPSRTGGMGGSV